MKHPRDDIVEGRIKEEGKGMAHIMIEISQSQNPGQDTIHVIPGPDTPEDWDQRIPQWGQGAYGEDDLREYARQCRAMGWQVSAPSIDDYGDEEAEDLYKAAKDAERLLWDDLTHPEARRNVAATLRAALQKVEGE